jgi:hypothetical protein
VCLFTVLAADRGGPRQAGRNWRSRQAGRNWWCSRLVGRNWRPRLAGRNWRSRWTMYSYSPPIFLLKRDLIWGFGDTRTYFASIVISVVRFTPNLAPRWPLRPKLPHVSPVWAGACHGFVSLCHDSPRVPTAVSGTHSCSAAFAAAPVQ